ncbi:F510_1955 family glycosylhydrolase [Actinotalea sp. K2]|uniref:F510_1955 family glycosylhydrolase n=1 Tax=Actinotalea sp. K2 TaxID=2939438 RepID=UPI0020179717|nr:exo-alpha-sialidase [Actinotalea sp. K2]MCL3862996.1 exo-alpha-sialidase [Actinotalea sp. K2]
MPPSTTTRRTARATLSAAVMALVLASCSATTDTGTNQTPSPAEAARSEGLPSDHVHGVAFNPADDKVYLATHDGLFRYDETGPVRVGPVIDLMGFTAAGPDHFYSSGHPGAGVDLPNPVGLIESTDAGQTWTPLSRQGQTDFHTLSASQAGVVGLDGTTVIASADGQSWSTLDPGVATHALAASPDGTTLLATSASGPARSTDSGITWTVEPEAPLLQLAHFADDLTVAGVAPDGGVFLSTDAGATWELRGTVGEAPQAITTRLQAQGDIEILVVVADALLRSADGGSSFTR